MNYRCECFNGSYSGPHCQITARRIIIYRIVAKSFAYVAIIAIVCVEIFVITMDVLNYFFGIDLIPEDLECIQKAKQANSQICTSTKSI